MASHDETTLYEDVLGTTDVPAQGDFTLEEILAEYGYGTAALADLNEADLSDEDSSKEEESDDAPAPPLQPDEPAEPQPSSPPDIPPPPKPVTVEQVMEETVSAVIEEQESSSPPRRRGLFSRKPMVDTEELYPAPEPPKPTEPVIGWEPDLSNMAKEYRTRFRRQKRLLIPAALATLICLIIPVTELAGWPQMQFLCNPKLQASIFLTLLLLVCSLGYDVFLHGLLELRKKHLTASLLLVLPSVATAIDCVRTLIGGQRTDVPPYALIPCVGVTIGIYALYRDYRALADVYRIAAIGDPPYLCTDISAGACKQAGQTEGFYTGVNASNPAALWQTILLPFLLTASLVFAFLSSYGQDRPYDFLLNWSAILSAGMGFALPLTWALPFSKLSHQLQKSGSAVAGYSGAAALAKKKTIIVSDNDLFPPGTVHLNGIKIYGEDLPKVTSYAASLVRASGCGLDRIFQAQMMAESGHFEPVEDFSYYEEGGISGMIHGEHTLLGTASFMRKMEIRLPGNINLKTGLFLSFDGVLAAVFAIKYQPSDNVAWALKLLRRNHITPVLASRDPNLTPTLLQRKFNRRVKVLYPNLSERLALSEQETAKGLPRALLYREGLLPYAEMVAGSCRLRGTVLACTILSVLGNVCGLVLTFYLAFLGQYQLLTPSALLAFLLLWTLPTLLLSERMRR